MELRTYLEIVRRYWRPLVVIPLVAALTALVATFVVSPRFVGMATIQVIPEDVEPRTITLRSQDGPSTVAIGLKDPTELLAQGIIENLGSREVVETIVDELGMEQWPEPQGFAAFKARVRGYISDAWTYMQHGYVVRPSKREILIYAVERSLEAELVRGSYYMTVQATWNDPEVASQVANTAVKALVAHIRNVANRSAREQSDFLESQVSDTRARMEKARDELIHYGETSNAVGQASLGLALDAQQKARDAVRQNALDLSAVNSQVQDVQAQLGATEQRITTNRTTVGSTSEDSGSQLEQSGQNPAWQTATDRVRELEQEVAALQARLRTATGQTRSTIQADLTGAQQRLSVARRQLSQTARESQTVQRAPASRSSSNTTSESTDINPVYQLLQEQQASLRQQAEALQAQQTKLADELRARDAEVRQLVSQDAKLMALNEELQLATNIYGRRLDQWNDALLESVRPVSLLRLIDPSVVPIYPVRPIIYRWVLMGLAAGLVAAIVLVFVRHSTDMRVRSVADAEAALALTTLAVVPRPRESNRASA